MFSNIKNAAHQTLICRTLPPPLFSHVIAQQFSPTTAVSLPSHPHKQKLSVRFSNLICVIFL
jgi:hypothetical protein